MSGPPEFPLNTFLSMTLLARFLAWKRCSSLTALVIDTNSNLLYSAISTSPSLGITPSSRPNTQTTFASRPLAD
jgi:hypothetical protein